MSEKFSAEDDETLIDLVRQHPPLYTVSGKSYKDLVLKNNIWKKIGEKMRKSEKACQVRWKNIRDYYQKKKREAKKAMTTGSASNNGGDSFSNKYKHLSFLDNTSLVERQSVGSIIEDSQCSNQETEQLESDSHDDIEECQEPGGSQVASATEIIPTAEAVIEESGRTFTSTSSRKKPRMSQERTAVVEEFKKGRMERTRLIKELLQTDKPRESESAVSMFFRSIAATVEQFPPALQTRAKVQVMNVISQLEFENHEINVRHDVDFRSSTATSHSDSSLHFDQLRSPSASSYLRSFTPQDNLMPPDSPITHFEQL